MADSLTPPRPPDDRFRDRMSRSLITDPLLGRLLEDPAALYRVIIDPNSDFDGGRPSAIRVITDLIREFTRGSNALGQSVRPETPGATHGYIFATLTGTTIQLLVQAVLEQGRRRPRDPGHATSRASAVYRIWEDTQVPPLINRSVATVKADAAHIAFSARGKEIVWAVLDSGIDQHHPHFQAYKNLDVPVPLVHQSFTSNLGADPLADSFGHGTHVAGIIAGGMTAQDAPCAALKTRDESGAVSYGVSRLGNISGTAPECKLVSLKVLEDDGTGHVSSLIDAIDAIQRTNDHGKRIRIHGANLSVGYEFDPEWFGCGHSPLCVEVNRLVRSGVVVVVAAGNTGYGWNQTMALGSVAAGMGYSINDPGNAELAITVGSTHRDRPHLYGVSYFSSKGPTGDGRAKPDLVAPGERIISCATGKLLSDIQRGNKGLSQFQYAEDTGTSMAAPHVSGVIAAFLSVRSEFIGEPQDVKDLFVSSAVSLKRDRLFQGAGLVDLMKAIQSV